MVRIPTDRPPTHPGEMLLEEFLKPMQMSQRQIADAIRVPYQRINEIINGRRGISPGTACAWRNSWAPRRTSGSTCRLRWDLYHAQASERRTLKAIRRHTPASAR